jgi:hypothetical protein
MVEVVGIPREIKCSVRDESGEHLRETRLGWVWLDLGSLQRVWVLFCGSVHSTPTNWAFGRSDQ